AVVLRAAAWLPAVEARPIPALREGIQRLAPLTARGPGAGFGGPGTGAPDQALALGGPFRPSRQTLLVVAVTTGEGETAELPATLYLRGIARPVYTGASLEAASPDTLAAFSGDPPEITDMPGLRLEQEVEVVGTGGRLLYGAHRV